MAIGEVAFVAGDEEVGGGGFGALQKAVIRFVGIDRRDLGMTSDAYALMSRSNSVVLLGAKWNFGRAKTNSYSARVAAETAIGKSLFVKRETTTASFP